MEIIRMSKRNNLNASFRLSKLPLVADMHLLDSDDPALDEVAKSASQRYTATAAVELLPVDGSASSQSLLACMYSRFAIL